MDPVKGVPFPVTKLKTTITQVYFTAPQGIHDGSSRSRSEIIACTTLVQLYSDVVGLARERLSVEAGASGRPEARATARPRRGGPATCVLFITHSKDTIYQLLYYLSPARLYI